MEEFFASCLRNDFLMTSWYQNISELPQHNPYRNELFPNMLKVLNYASNFVAKIKTNVHNLQQDKLKINN